MRRVNEVHGFEVAELAARIELAAFYRVVHRHGLTDQIYNHITLKLPGEEEAFLINPYGLRYDEVTASNLMKVNYAGEILFQAEPSHRLNFTGFVIHGAIHRARPDLHCVAHTHSEAGIAISALEEGILPLSQSALRFTDNIGYHDFEGFAVDRDEEARLVADLASADNLVLRNHGLVSCGRTVAQCCINLLQLELVARAQLAVLATGRPIRLIGKAAIESAQSTLNALRSAGEDGAVEWQAHLRWLADHSPDYRT